MDTWTPPLVEAPSFIAADSASKSHWQLTRVDSADAPLCLIRPDGVTLTIDFTAGKTRHRTTESGMGAQGLSKALGVKAFVKAFGRYPTIIDATGGLGQDAWALASTGCTIVIIERHPIVHALLHDALARANDHPDCVSIAQRVSLIHGEAIEQSETSAFANAHAVYLDPMYPDRRKKANSKKGMQFLHALLGPPSSDDPALLLWALATGVTRVAVKRPKGAPLLAGTELFAGQRTAIESANTRFDIYHCK